MGSLYLLLLIAALCSMVSAFQHNPVIGSTGVRLVSTRKFLFGNPEPPKNNGKKDGGLLGGLGNMGNMMENIKKAQETAQKIQKELSVSIFAYYLNILQFCSTFFTGMEIHTGNNNHWTRSHGGGDFYFYWIGLTHQH